MSAGAMLWSGRSLSALVVLFLLGASSLPKLAGMRAAIDPMATLGWDPRHVFLIGIIELACALLYAIPATAMLGAILTTALLGGAIATQWRADQPLASHVLFGVYLGVALWAGLWLRDPAIRALIPLRMH